MSFLIGLVIGISTILFVGPVFFLLLQTSIQQGKIAGIWVALGIALSDVLILLIYGLGFSTLLASPTIQFWLNILGIIILSGFGLQYLFKKPTPLSIIKEKRKAPLSAVLCMAQGFSVNFFNPFVFGVWLSIYQFGQSNFLNTSAFLVFFTAVIFGIIGTDILKVLLANDLKNKLTQKRLLYFYRISGLVFILFSIRIAFFTLETY